MEKFVEKNWKNLLKKIGKKFEKNWEKNGGGIYSSYATALYYCVDSIYNNLPVVLFAHIFFLSVFAINRYNFITICPVIIDNSALMIVYNKALQRRSKNHRALRQKRLSKPKSKEAYE